MSEYRQDPLSGRWVVIAEERANRPNQFDVPYGTEGKGHKTRCPFCPGNEADTPDEIDAIRSEDGTKNDSAWMTRVVPNRFPAITTQKKWGEWENDLLVHSEKLLFSHNQSFPGYGSHEVLIETPRHLLSIAEFDDHEILNMFRIYRRRLLAHREAGIWKHALIFKNVGASAGASLFHTHSQLMAMPFVPPPIRQELRREVRYYESHKRCYWCGLIDDELAEAKRVVSETEHFLMLCPFVSRFPMEISIFPKRHCSHFELMSENLTDALAFFVRKCVRTLEKAVFWNNGPLAYNMILKSGPFAVQEYCTDKNTQNSEDLSACCHFYITLLPSLAKAAGFEWGTGLHINPISPETAAQRLRDNSIDR
ncbi:MAG: hypothetical protein LBQ54_10755 [Planctomycetaceae bacterium]|jgi:UDPglucose--hexose-1-phosphate uridylyltransferase|nr:hypothetical protein [Planctomycetaceae bacterium]